MSKKCYSSDNQEEDIIEEDPVKVDGREWYGRCGMRVDKPCCNSFCCHPEKCVRTLQHVMQDAAIPEDLGCYVSINNPDYNTNPEHLKCKYCDAEKSLSYKKPGELLLWCSGCGNQTRPYNYRYASQEAEAADVGRKRHAAEAAETWCTDSMVKEKKIKRRKELALGAKAAAVLKAKLDFSLALSKYIKE